MPVLPWTSRAVAEPDREYVVMASRLPLARFRHVPAFLRATITIRRQLARADGLIGYSLDAKLLSKTFWTLSVWRDEESLGAFAQAAPHRDRVQAIRPHMEQTTFVTWTVPGIDLPVPWAQARQRVEAAFKPAH
jgi:heme-degrading monooxygenase HmoA